MHQAYMLCKPTKLFNKVIIVILITVNIDVCAQQIERIQLLVRADDMGAFHSTNLACLKAYNDGVAKSIEVMVPCNWFPEAATMLSNYSSCDVGLHLVLTSEWEVSKWRPLTDCPNLVDSDGYFFSKIWPENNDSSECLLNATWKINEIEKELRAQIELGLKHIPQASHLSAHMGFTYMSSDVMLLVEELAHEYGLRNESELEQLQMPRWQNDSKLKRKIQQFIRHIRELTPGDYLLVCHPGHKSSEMIAINPAIANLRNDETLILTKKRVQKALKKKGVQLVSYNEIFGGNQN